jgi:uncharacterized protein YecE (DUF72 family)
MEFGYLSPEELDKVNFQLPVDSPFNNQVLNAAPGAAKTRYYIGCGKWGRKDWIGKIFPAGSKEKDFLEYYISQFNSIELNATAYQIYGPATISKWAEKATGKDFMFCPKVSQSITRTKDLLSPHIQELTKKYLDGISAFKENLGPLLLQFGEHFSPAKKENLYGFLQTLPDNLEVFVEVRHPDWYALEDIRTDYFETLRKLKKGAVITDVAGRRDCVHMQLPIAKTFVRFVGNHLHPTDFTRLDEWVTRLGNWAKKGMKEVYFFMHHPEEKESPELCDYFIEQLNKHLKTDLKRPVFVTDTASA